LEYAYTKIPNVFFLHITGDDVSRATKGITNATMISKAIVSIMRSKGSVVTMW
jgi:hypothetical protein